MRKFRKTAAVVAAAALALSLCACGGKTDKATTEQISGGGATVTDATASTIEDDGDWTTTEQEVVEDDRFTTVEGACRRGPRGRDEGQVVSLSPAPRRFRSAAVGVRGKYTLLGGIFLWNSP